MGAESIRQQVIVIVNKPRKRSATETGDTAYDCTRLDNAARYDTTPLTTQLESAEPNPHVLDHNTLNDQAPPFHRTASRLTPFQGYLIVLPG